MLKKNVMKCVDISEIFYLDWKSFKRKIDFTVPLNLMCHKSSVFIPVLNQLVFGLRNLQKVSQLLIFIYMYMYIERF